MDVLYFMSRAGIHRIIQNSAVDVLKGSKRTALSRPYRRVGIMTESRMCSLVYKPYSSSSTTKDNSRSEMQEKLYMQKATSVSELQSSHMMESMYWKLDTTSTGRLLVLSRTDTVWEHLLVGKTVIILAFLLLMERPISQHWSSLQ